MFNVGKLSSGSAKHIQVCLTLRPSQTQKASSGTEARACLLHAEIAACTWSSAWGGGTQRVCILGPFESRNLKVDSSFKGCLYERRNQNQRMEATARTPPFKGPPSLAAEVTNPQLWQPCPGPFSRRPCLRSEALGQEARNSSAPILILHIPEVQTTPIKDSRKARFTSGLPLLTLTFVEWGGGLWGETTHAHMLQPRLAPKRDRSAKGNQGKPQTTSFTRSSSREVGIRVPFFCSLF